MSGESASVVEVCSVIAAGAGKVAMGTLVAARAVGTAPGAGLSEIGRRMEGRHTHHQQRQAELAAWEQVAREVVDRNARLSVLAARPGGAPGLPAPLVLSDQSLEELTEWCAATDEALRGAERALVAEAAAAVSTALTAASASGATDAAGVLAEHRPAGTEPPAELIEACGRILGGLRAEVSATDRAEVLAAVGRVRECTSPADQQGWLAEVRVRVRQANDLAARRADDARTAATMLQALAETDQPRQIPARTLTLRGELADVVAGQRALDPELRAEALAACEQVRAERENSYVRDALTRGLEQLGYDVDQGFDTFTAQGARLRLSRGQWPEHAVSVVVDGEQVRTMVVRTEAGEGDDAERLDAEREEQWCADFDELRDQLADDGLRLDVQRLVPAGQRHVPVAARRRSPAGEQRQRRKRER